MIKQYLKLLILPVTIGLFDTLFKILAVVFIEQEQLISVCSSISLYLVYNTTPFNSFLHLIGYASNIYVLFGSFLYVVFGFLLIIVPGKVKRRGFRILVYVAFFVSISIFLRSLMFVCKDDVAISPYLVSLIRFIGPLFVSAILFLTVRNKIFKYLWGLYLGGGLGNFLSLLYPPFAVVDYIYINNSSNIGVFNLADVIITVSVCLLVVYSLIYLVIHLSKGIVRKIQSIWCGRESNN